MQWIPTSDEIKYYKLLVGDTSTSDEYYMVMLPLMLDSLNEQLCQCFTSENLPASLKLYLAKSVNFFACDGSLKSRSMGTVSYSYDRSALPSSVTGLLKGYDKCSYGRFVVFR